MSAVENTAAKANGQGNTGKKISAAYAWTTVGNFFRYGSGFVISILLARLLPPSTYGLVGMVTLAIGFATVLQDMGIGQALVYFRDDHALEKYFTLSFLSGIVYMMLSWVAAPWIARFYHEPQLIVLLRVMALTLPLTNLRAVSSAVLTRDLRFKEIAVVESITSIVCGLLAVGLAWAGFGVWSLVDNLLLLTITQTIWFSLYIRPRFTASIHPQEIKKVLAWGLPLSGSTLLWQFYDNADYLVVGRVMGSEALGWYTFAFRLATLVNQRISSVINRVSFPSFSSMKDDPSKVVDHWFSVTRKLALLNFPLLAVLGVNASDLIKVTVGDKWMPAAMPLRFLCMVGALKTILPLANNVLAAFGRTGLALRCTILTAIALPTGFVIGCYTGGLLGVGIAWCTIQPFTGLVVITAATRAAGIPLRAYFSNLRHAVVLTFLCVVAMLPFGLLPVGIYPRLIIRGLAGLICFTIYTSRLSETREIVGRTGVILKGAQTRLRALMSNSVTSTTA